MNWYYRNGDAEIGPVADAAMTSLILANVIKEDTPVWREGLPDWVSAADSGLIEKSVSRPPPYQVQQAPQATAKNNDTGMFVLGIIALAVGLIVMAGGVVPVGGALIAFGVWRIVLSFKNSGLH